MCNSKCSFIIIGAAGFIGSSFSKYLRQTNNHVFDVVRGQISGVESGVHLMKEIFNSTCTQQIIVDFAYASIPNSTVKNRVGDYFENLYNTIRHLEFVRKLPNAAYVYISSGGTIYGDPEYRQPINESSVSKPLSPYGITKLSCEKYVQMYKDVYGLNIKIVRPSNVYGPGQKPFRGQGIIPTAVAKILKKQPIQVFGEGLNVRDYLYIDDFCKILHDIIEHGNNGGIYNAGTGIGYSINQVLENIRSLLRSYLSIEYLPLRSLDVSYNVLDSSTGSSLNNWSPSVSLKEGLQSTIQWIQNL